MTFKSEAQRRKMHQLQAEGKLKPGTVAKWEAATPNKADLPKRIHPKSKPASKKK